MWNFFFRWSSKILSVGINYWTCLADGWTKGLDGGQESDAPRCITLLIRLDGLELKPCLVHQTAHAHTRSHTNTLPRTLQLLISLYIFPSITTEKTGLSSFFFLCVWKQSRHICDCLKAKREKKAGGRVLLIDSIDLPNTGFRLIRIPRTDSGWRMTNRLRPTEKKEGKWDWLRVGVCNFTFEVCDAWCKRLSRWQQHKSCVKHEHT